MVSSSVDQWDPEHRSLSAALQQKRSRIQPTAEGGFGARGLLSLRPELSDLQDGFYKERLLVTGHVDGGEQTLWSGNRYLSISSGRIQVLTSAEWVARFESTRPTINKYGEDILAVEGTAMTPQEARDKGLSLEPMPELNLRIEEGPDHTRLPLSSSTYPQQESE